MTKKKTPTKAKEPTLRNIYDLLSAHHWTQEHSDFEKLMRDHIEDQTRLIQILLARCDAQDKAIGSIEHCVRHLMEDANAMLSRVNKQDQQMDRLIALDWLMLRRMERFCKTQLEPATVESIRKDLKTPTLPTEHHPV